MSMLHQHFVDQLGTGRTITSPAGKLAASQPRAARSWGARVLGFVGALGVMIGAVSAQPISAADKRTLLDQAERLVREEAFASGVDFEKWPDHVARFKSRLDEAKTVPAFTATVNRVLNEFGISHLDLLSPAAADASRGSEFTGIGVRFAELGRERRIMDVLKGSPAERAGLKVGEIIIAADGKDVDDTRVLRGPSGTIVNVTVRTEAGEERTVPVTRGKVNFRTPESVTFDADDVAIVRVPTFHSDYDRANVAKIVRDAMKRKRMVIDLRDNGGGEVRNMLHFLGFFLPSGQAIGTSVSKEATDAYVRAEGGDPKDVKAIAEWMKDKMRIIRSERVPYRGQIAVLINGASASASEIVAQTLVELKGAVLVGTPTAGAVLVSTYEELPGGYRMKVPHSEYISLKGRRLEGNPLQPDFEIAQPRMRRRAAPADASATDRVVETALRELRREDIANAPAEPKPTNRDNDNKRDQ
ncbi:MAG: PDZ domain-containing protein [Phycisphaerales bacterium]|nr:PDZ domain-containing protein [Phycisphaerales bacterium]